MSKISRMFSVESPCGVREDVGSLITHDLCTLYYRLHLMRSRLRGMLCSYNMIKQNMLSGGGCFVAGTIAGNSFIKYTNLKMYMTFGSVVERAGGRVFPAFPATPLQTIHSETYSATSSSIRERLIRLGSF